MKKLIIIYLSVLLSFSFLSFSAYSLDEKNILKSLQEMKKEVRLAEKVCKKEKATDAAILTATIGVYIVIPLLPIWDFMHACVMSFEEYGPFATSMNDARHDISDNRKKIKSCKLLNKKLGDLIELVKIHQSEEVFESSKLEKMIDFYKKTQELDGRGLKLDLPCDKILMFF